jgi:hypothetical protein
MSSDYARTQEIREENDELQDEEQFGKSEEFENQGFEYGSPLDDNPKHAYSEGNPEPTAADSLMTGDESPLDTKFRKKK